MDTFFNILKKTLVTFVFVVFAFVATYIPQSYHQVETAEAGAGAGNVATEPTQILNNIELAGINIAATASAASDAVTSFATNNLWVKEYVLDGIGWAIAKRIVSEMVRSLINWINSGFQGSPAFVEDLGGFLLQVADEAIGAYIQELGGIGSFICSPFQLDVQLSVAYRYQQYRDGYGAPECTLTGIIDNLEGFVSGNFSQGGWNDWFDITAQPDVYTPYGSILTAQEGARVRLVNAQGEEMSLLNFGDGFLSGEICETVHGEGTETQDCFISKPGKIIQEALTFNLDSGRQSLITADEVNEVIAALLGQLANTALTGINGLLGLGGNSRGYSYSDSSWGGGSYLDEMVDQSSGLVNGDAIRVEMQRSLDVQIQYRNAASTYLPRLLAKAGSPSTTNIPGEGSIVFTVPPATNIDEADEEGTRNQAERAAGEAQLVLNTTEGVTPTPGTIFELTTIINDFDEADNDTLEQQDLLSYYYRLDLYSANELQSSVTNWQTIMQRD